MPLRVNSVAAYDGLDLDKRCRIVLKTFLDAVQPLSDREAKERLRFDDMNQVRPRITDMVKAGWLEECGETRDHVTKKRVRLCRPTAFAITKTK